jgi:hypothetical protein
VILPPAKWSANLSFAAGKTVGKKSAREKLDETYTLTNLRTKRVLTFCSSSYVSYQPRDFTISGPFSYRAQRISPLERQIAVPNQGYPQAVSTGLPS